jgi:hypothetical protein
VLSLIGGRTVDAASDAQQLPRLITAAAHAESSLVAGVIIIRDGAVLVLLAVGSQPRPSSALFFALFLP